jgi:hypothetical protein
VKWHVGQNPVGKMSLPQRKITDFLNTHIDQFEGKNLLAIFSEFFFFSGQKKLIPGQEDMKIKKNFFYFGFIILLPIQIQLLDIENPKYPTNLKIYSPY